MNDADTVGRFVKSGLRAKASYAPGVSPSAPTGRVVRLDWNESPFPPSPKAQQAVMDMLQSSRYPDFAQTELRSALASYLDAPAERIVAGAGLDDVFNTLAMLVIEPGDEVIVSEPTFGVYRSLFSLHGATIRDVPLGAAPDFALDPDELIAAVSERTKVVIICNPNNPTGNLFPVADVERVVRSVSCLVAIDEAYAEFSGTSHRALADGYGNIVILRTMSKFASLAGYRVGYGLFPTALVPYLSLVTPPFCNVSAVGAAAAVASLADFAVLQGNIDALVQERDRLRSALNQIDGVIAYPSATNFLLVRLPVADAGPVAGELARRGVFIRRYPDPSLGLIDCIRVNASTPEENDIFLTELWEILETMRPAAEPAETEGTRV